MSGLLEIANVLPHRIRRPLVPIRRASIVCWAARDLDKPGTERIEPIGLANMTMQADRHELRQHVDPIQSAVDAVRQAGYRSGDTCRPAGPPVWNDTGQRKQASPATSTQHESHHVAHEWARLIFQMRSRDPTPIPWRQDNSGWVSAASSLTPLSAARNASVYNPARFSTAIRSRKSGCCSSRRSDARPLQPVVSECLDNLFRMIPVILMAEGQSQVVSIQRLRQRQQPNRKMGRDGGEYTE